MDNIGFFVTEWLEGLWGKVLLGGGDATYPAGKWSCLHCLPCSPFKGILIISCTTASALSYHGEVVLLALSSLLSLQGEILRANMHRLD